MEKKPILCQRCNSNNIQIVNTLEKEKRHTKLATAMSWIGLTCFIFGIFIFLVCLQHISDFLTFEATNTLPSSIIFSDYLFFLIAKAITPFGIISFLLGIALYNLTPYEYSTKIYILCLDCGIKQEIILNHSIDSNKTYVEQLLENKKKN